MKTLKYLAYLFLVFTIITLVQFSFVKKETTIDWTRLQVKEEVDNGIKSNTPVLFFKHSFKCGFSTKVLKDFEHEWNINSEKCNLYFVDVIRNRDVSDYIEQVSGFKHHSPQVLVFIGGKVVYHATHQNINVKKIKEVLETF